MSKLKEMMDGFETDFIKLLGKDVFDSRIKDNQNIMISKIVSPSMYLYLFKEATKTYNSKDNKDYFTPADTHPMSRFMILMSAIPERGYIIECVYSKFTKEQRIEKMDIWDKYRDNLDKLKKLNNRKNVNRMKYRLGRKVS